MFSIFHLWLILAFIILTGVILVRTFWQYFHHKSTKIIMSTSIVIFSITLIATSVILGMGKKHAMDPFKTSLITAIQYLTLTPIEDKVPELPGSVILYYKFNSNTSASIYKELNAYALNKTFVYWVSTESEQGKQILNDYPVTEVPSAIYILRNNNGHTIEYLVNENGYLDRPALNKLFDIQKQELPQTKNKKGE